MLLIEVHWPWKPLHTLLSHNSYKIQFTREMLPIPGPELLSPIIQLLLTVSSPVFLFLHLGLILIHQVALAPTPPAILHRVPDLPVHLPQVLW